MRVPILNNLRKRDMRPCGARPPDGWIWASWNSALRRGLAKSHSFPCISFSEEFSERNCRFLRMYACAETGSSSYRHRRPGRHPLQSHQPAQRLGRPRRLAGLFRHLLEADLRGRPQGRSLGCRGARRGAGNRRRRGQTDARRRLRPDQKLVQELALPHHPATHH